MRTSGKVHLLAKATSTIASTIASTLCGVDPLRVRISYPDTISGPERVTCPECLEANAPKVELTPGVLRRHGMTDPTIWQGKYYTVTMSRGGKYWSGIGQAYAKKGYAIVRLAGGHVAHITGRQTKAEVNDFVRWAMVLDALEPQRLAEEAEAEAAQQKLIDAQQRQAEKAELLRRNGPRMVKLLRETWRYCVGEVMNRPELVAEINALFKDLGEDVTLTSGATQMIEDNRELLEKLAKR